MSTNFPGGWPSQQQGAQTTGWNAGGLPAAVPVAVSVPTPVIRNASHRLRELPDAWDVAALAVGALTLAALGYHAWANNREHESIIARVADVDDRFRGDLAYRNWTSERDQQERWTAAQNQAQAAAALWGEIEALRAQVVAKAGTCAASHRSSEPPASTPPVVIVTQPPTSYTPSLGPISVPLAPAAIPTASLTTFPATYASPVSVAPSTLPSITPAPTVSLRPALPSVPGGSDGAALRATLRDQLSRRASTAALGRLATRR